MEPLLNSTITCPECGHAREEAMPTDACWWLYECEGCHALLRPKAGDCCVFCSYGTVPCPDRQATRMAGRCGEGAGSALEAMKQERPDP